MAKKKHPEKEEQDPLSLFIKKSNILIQKYFKLVFLILLAGVLIFGLFLLYCYWQEKENKKASELLYQSRKELVLAEQKAGGDIMGVDSGQNFFGQTKKAKYNSEMDKSAQQYISVIKSWISKPAGLSAAVEIAHFLYQYEKHSEALSLLNVAQAYRKKNLTGFLMAFQLGTYLMNQGKYEESIKNFQFIVTAQKAKWLWPEALVKMALCYERQHKTDQAREIYKRIKNDFSDSQASDKSIRYLNLLKLKKKMKNHIGDKKNNVVLEKTDDDKTVIEDDVKEINNNSGE